MAETQHSSEVQDKRQPPGGNGGEQLPDDVEALKAQLAEERRKNGNLINESKAAKKAREELAAKLRVWSDLEEDGYEAEQVKALVKQQREEDLNKARSQGEIDKLLADRDKKHAKERQEIMEKYEYERTINNEVMIDNVLLQELAKVVEPKLLKGAFSLHRPRIKLIDDPEAPHKRRTVVQVDDEYMTVHDWVKKWAEDDEEAQAYLKPSAASGGGASGIAGGKFRVQLYRKQMSAPEKSKYIREHGKHAYDALPWEQAQKP